MSSSDNYGSYFGSPNSEKRGRVIWIIVIALVIGIIILVIISTVVFRSEPSDSGEECVENIDCPAGMICRNNRCRFNNV